MPLTQKQRKQIEAYTNKFKDWSTTEEGREDKLVRDERKKKFQNLFSRKNLESLHSTEHFVEIVRENFWCARNLLRFNEKKIVNHGIERIRNELVELLYGDSPLYQRLENFTNIKNGLGQAFTTELLNYYYPNKAVLVNEKLREVEQEILGRINRDYVTHKEFVDEIKGLLQEKGVGIVDYTEVDSFIYFLHSSLSSGPRARTQFSGFEEGDFDKLGSLEGNKEISEKLSALASALIEKFPERMQQIVNFQVSRVTKPYTSTPRNHMWVMFGKEPRGIQNLVHPEVLIWRKANEVDVRLNACSTEHAAVSSGERKLFSKKIKQHLTDFKRLLKNLGPEYSLEYKLNYGEEGEQRASELDEKVIDDLAEKGIKDFLIVRKFGPEEIFQDNFVDEIREIMVEKYWPLYTFSLKEGPFGIEELTYFILQTGGGEYEDEPERRYHFKQGIPGSVQLRNAENKGKFVYYENGKFYGKGDIGKITSYEEDGVTYYYVEIKNFQRIKPIDINYVGDDLSFDSVGQAGIRRISREDYDTIVTLVPMLKLKRFNLQPSELKNMVDLQLPAELFDQICRALNAGKHIILTGPVGTGKTDLAKGIGEAAKELGYSRGYILTTATSDWTTFDTIGGYMPDSSRGLTFQQGTFLDALQNNQMLIIDEINRADIDKAFGQLFTVLSGQPVKLPFRLDGKILSINPGEHVEGGFDEENASYRVGKNWRIVATMNVYDKNFLYEMSYAFMRRFAFIYVDIPKEEYYEKLVDGWAGDSISEDTKKGLMKLTKLGGRRIGPAVIKDIVGYLKMAGNREIERLAETVVAYILPQLEGIEKEKMEEAWRKIGKQVFKNNIEIANTKVKPIFEEITGIKLEDVPEDGA